MKKFDDQTPRQDERATPGYCMAVYITAMLACLGFWAAAVYVMRILLTRGL